MWVKSWLIVIFTSLLGIAVAQTDQRRSQELAVDEAVSLALRLDPGARERQAMSESLRATAHAERGLPDIEIKTEIEDLPVNSLRRDSETMVRYRAQQAFPKGKTLRLNAEKSNILADRFRILTTERKLDVARNVRQAWYELAYWLKAESIIKSNRGFMRQALQVTQDQYRTGRGNQYDVLRGQLEYDMLTDKMREIETMQLQARTQLSRWIGEEQAARPLATVIPELAALPPQAILKQRLAQHPKLQSEQQSINAKRKEVEVAKEQFKPGVMLELGFSDRTSIESAVTIGVGVQVPLFNRKKYDHRLSAAQSEVRAEMAKKDDAYLMLLREYQERSVVFDKLKARYQQFKSVLLPKAQANARVTLAAYRNGGTSFNDLMKARITALEVEMQLYRIMTEQRKVHADLLYLTAGNTQ